MVANFVSPEGFIKYFQHSIRKATGKDFSQLSSTFISSELDKSISMLQQAKALIDESFRSDVLEIIEKEINSAELEIVEKIVISDKNFAQDEQDSEAITGVEDISKKGGMSSVTLSYRAYYGPKGVVGTLKGFRHILSQLRKKSDDLSPLFNALAKDWFATNEKEVFNFSESNNPLGWAPLNDVYKVEKEKAIGFVYPFLVKHGTLKQSLVDIGNPNAVVDIGPKSMTLGSNDPEVKMHADGGYFGVKWRTSGTVNTYLPPRNPVQIGSQKRLTRWHNMAAKYANKISLVGVQNA